MLFRSLFLYVFIICLINETLKNGFVQSLKCRDSCRSNQSNKYLQNCFCSDCALFDDCCVDASRNISDSSVSSQLEFGCILPVEVTNSQVRDQKQFVETVEKYKAYAVNKCAKWWTDNEIRNKCEQLETYNYTKRKNLEQEEIYKIIPVFNNEIEIAFKNVYCAICSTLNFKLEVMKFFSLNLKYEEDQFSIATQNTNKTQNDYEMLKEAIESFMLREILKNDFSISLDLPVRRCVDISENNCPIDSFLGKKCSNYTAYRYYGKKAFRNKDCALCHEINEESLSCTPTERLKRQTKRFMSLQVLFDFNPYNKKKILVRANGNIMSHFGNKSNDTLFKIKISSDIIENSLEYKHEFVKFVLTKVLLSISIMSLVLLLIIYIGFKNLRTLNGKLTISLSISLILAQFFFVLSGALIDYSQESTRFSLRKFFKPCTLSGFLTHYFFLTYFFWLSIISVDMFIAIRSQSVFEDSASKKKWFLAYSGVGWAFPFLIVLALFFKQIFKEKLSYGVNFCFISIKKDLFYFFVAPVSILLFVNLFLLNLVIILIIKHDQTTRSAFRKDEAKFNFKKLKKRLILYVKLVSISGVTWIFGIISSMTNNDVLWYIYITLNSFQGLFIFLSYLLSKKVKKELKTLRSSHKETHSSGNAQKSFSFSTQSANVLFQCLPTHVKSSSEDLSNKKLYIKDAI